MEIKVRICQDQMDFRSTMRWLYIDTLINVFDSNRKKSRRRTIKKNSLQFAMLLAFLTACTSPKVETQTPPLQATVASLWIGDGGLISAQPCASPCFFGVQIGETKLDQAVSALENNGLYSCHKDIDAVYCDYSVVISANPATNMVDTIGYEPTVPISIEEINQKYGGPNLVQVFPVIFQKHRVHL